MGLLISTPDAGLAVSLTSELRNRFPGQGVAASLMDGTHVIRSKIRDEAIEAFVDGYATAYAAAHPNVRVEGTVDVRRSLDPVDARGDEFDQH